MYKMDVVVPELGKKVGQVEDFYVQEGTNAIYALSVRTRLDGDLSLPVTGITAVEQGRVTIPNPHMLLKAIPPFTPGQKLIGRNVVGENGQEVGTIKEVLLGVDPPSAMRVAGFEVVRGSHARTFSADGIAHYDDETNNLIIHDQTAKRLR